MNDRKLAKVSRMLVQDQSTLAKRDEQQYLKAVQEKEERAQRKESEDAQRLVRQKNNNLNGLQF
jgi:hypothetical protein